MVINAAHVSVAVNGNIRWTGATETGELYYVDGYNGNDTNDGETYSTAFKTFQHAHDVVNRGDTIVILSTGVNAILDEAIVITKDGLNIRGSGNNLIVYPSSGATAITVNADNCSISNISAASNSGYSIYITGNNVSVVDMVSLVSG